MKTRTEKAYGTSNSHIASPLLLTHHPPGQVQWEPRKWWWWFWCVSMPFHFDAVPISERPISHPFWVKIHEHSHKIQTLTSRGSHTWGFGSVRSNCFFLFQLPCFSFFFLCYKTKKNPTFTDIQHKMGLAVNESLHLNRRPAARRGDGRFLRLCPTTQLCFHNNFVHFMEYRGFVFFNVFSSWFQYDTAQQLVSQCGIRSRSGEATLCNPYRRDMFWTGGWALRVSFP